MYRPKNIHENLEVSRNMLNIAVPKNPIVGTSKYNKRSLGVSLLHFYTRSCGSLARKRGYVLFLHIDYKTCVQQCQRTTQAATPGSTVPVLHPLYSHVSLRAMTGTEQDLFVRNQTLEAI